MWYLTAMLHYADFRGRAHRAEFWEFLGGWVILTMLALAIDLMRAGPYGQNDHLIELAVTVTHLVPFFAVSARRSHDLDRSGWLALIGFVPLVGFAMLLVWAGAGTRGPNRFGPEPGSKPSTRREPTVEISGLGRTSFDLEPASIPIAAPRGVVLAQGGDSFALVDELERLASLRFREVLTDDEFEVLKARALEQGA
ncbi:MAG: DUF805 domain-containing protein [Janthinobacterium lividum]